MLNIKNILKFLILLQFLILFSVYYIEYIMNVYACKLCKYQRIPLNKKRFHSFLYVLCTSIIINIAISFYHVGIERKFFEENQACVTKKNPNNENELLNQLIKEKKSNCADVKFKLFKLSLSELNFITNVVFLIICVHIIRYEKKQKN